MGEPGRALGQASPRETCRWLATSTQAQAWGEIFWCQTGTVCQSPPPPPLPSLFPLPLPPVDQLWSYTGFPLPSGPLSSSSVKQAKGRQSALLGSQCYPSVTTGSQSSESSGRKFHRGRYWCVFTIAYHPGLSPHHGSHPPTAQSLGSGQEKALLYPARLVEGGRIPMMVVQH